METDADVKVPVYFAQVHHVHELGWLIYKVGKMKAYTRYIKHMSGAKKKKKR